MACVAPLAKALEDADEQVRWKAAVGLKAVGKDFVFALVAELLTGNLPAKHCAAWTLGELADPAGAGALASAPRRTTRPCAGRRPSASPRSACHRSPP